MTAVASYRLLFAQPDPETGERVCVGLLFEEPSRSPEVVYDRKLSKLRCVSPSTDLELVRFFLDALDASLKQARDVDGVLRTYSPQLTTSAHRSVVAPLTDATKMALANRFVLAEVAQPALAEARRSRAKKEEIQHFVHRITAPLQLRVIDHIRAHDVFGKPIPNVEAVAVGITTPTKVVLVDGVDLRSLTPKKSIDETNRVVHTFWQWGRLRTTPELATVSRPFERVGVILNGVIPEGKNVRKFLDAHDYARDQFNKEAELTVDSSSDFDTRKFQEMLAARE